jgi:GT2 family glycosyltransferase
MDSPPVNDSPMSRVPSVGIITVNYNGAAFIGEFAESLRRVRYPNFRLIVVDSASTDGSADKLARLVPDAVLLRSDENLGTAGGNNRGIARCLELGFDYVLILNNDTVLTEDFLDRLVAAADGRTIVVPKILYHYDRRLISTHAGGFDWRRGVFRHTFHGRPDSSATGEPRELETASFCCALVPAAAFWQVGRLDERFFMYYEETDWLRQARDRGYRLLYRPEAVIYHMESASSGGGWMTPFKHYYATRNRLYLVKKHSTSRGAYALFTAYFLAGRVFYLAWHLLRGRPRLARALVRGVVDYYRGCMGRTMEVGDL